MSNKTFRQLLLNIFLFSLLSSIISACSVCEPELSDTFDITSKYDQSTENVQNRVDDLYNSLFELNSTRSDGQATLSDLIIKLVQLPDTVLNDLYNQYCTDAKIEYYDSCCINLYLMVEELTSTEDLALLINFNRDYIEFDNPDIDFVINSADKKNKTIQNCIVCSASVIDYVRTDLKGSLPHNSYCLKRLITAISGYLVTSEIEREIIAELAAWPEAELIGALVLIGYDLFGAIKDVHEYQRCLITHPS